METMRASGTGPDDRAELAIRVLAMFNVVTGYFLSQPVLVSLSLDALWIAFEPGKITTVWKGGSWSCGRKRIALIRSPP